jgi:transposase
MREAPTTSRNAALTLGIDVGKSNLEVSLFGAHGGANGILAKTSVSNDPGGWDRLLSWLHDPDTMPEATPETTRVCMEASGGYEEGVARFLHAEDYKVSVVNPRRIKGYADSQLQRSKTDSADANLIARFGHREAPRRWTPPAAAASRLRELTRARQALKKEKTRTNNRLADTEEEALRDAYEDRLDTIEEKIDALEEEIAEQVNESPDLSTRCSLLTSIPGVALQTAAIVISELKSPDRFESARQVAAYAGLVPSHYQSGSSVRGQPRMSKVGNARLRSAMYYPAMTALRCNEAVKAFGNRLKERGKEQMVIIGAAMRKLLHICYGVLKSGRPFDPSLHPGTQNT